MRDKIALIIGAGPAGLSAAYHLLTETTDIKPIVIELENTVGGLAKSFYFGKNGTLGNQLLPIIFALLLVSMLANGWIR